MEKVEVIVASTFNVNGLPDDLLFEIFDFLDKETVESAVLVCRRWNMLILNSSRLSSKPTLFSNFSYHARLGLSPSLRLAQLVAKSRTFPYRNHRLYSLFNFEEFGTEQLRAFVDVTTRGRAERMSLSEVPHFLILRSIAVNQLSLTHLEVSVTREDLELCSDLERVELKGLKFLRIYEFYSLLCVLRCPNLRHFILSVIANPPSGATALADFLSCAPKLKSLHFIDFFPRLENLDFALDSLSLEITRRSPQNFLENLKALLATQGASLERLKIFNTIVDYRKILNIVNQQTSVKSFDFNGWFDETVHEEILFKNRTVRRLRLDIFMQINRRRHGNSNVREISKTLKEFPALEELCIVGYYENFGKFLRKYDFSALRSLQISTSYIINHQYREVRLENLTKLTIDCINSENSARFWIKMVSFAPNVSDLVVKRWFYRPRNKQVELKGSILQKLIKMASNVRTITIDECLCIPDGFVQYIKARSKLRLVKIGAIRLEDVEAMKRMFSGAHFEFVIFYSQELERTRWDSDPEYFQEKIF